MHMKNIFLISILILVVFLASCGSSQPSTAIIVNMTDFAFHPNRFVVPSGQEITLEIVNNGSVVHNFVLMKAGTALNQKFDETDESNIYWKLELTPGQNASTSFTAPTAEGEYLIVCSTEGHYEAGMTAKLVVVAE
jgi:uncharacterized cupredoxin-like copper-binding protein